MKQSNAFATLLTRVRQEALPVVVHSAQVSVGCVYVALPAVGTVLGNENFIMDAIQRGAAYIVGQERIVSVLDAKGVSFIAQAEPRAALGKLAAALYGVDWDKLAVVGISGTNGKTTCAYLLEHIFATAGYNTGVLGTISYRWPGYEEAATLTTPGCLTLHALLGKMSASSVDKAIMEVSSHALDQQRVAGIDFSGVLFTNLTQDHLDYHSSMEGYYQAKARLFHPVSLGGVAKDTKALAINADDHYGRRLLADLPQAIGYSLKNFDSGIRGQRMLQGHVEKQDTQGMRLRMKFLGQQWTISCPLIGSFNASNILAVQALCLAMGMEPRYFSALESFSGVCGRLERIDGKKGTAFVDFAHTPDALRKVLTVLRETGFKRIITVFGCGGDRDKAKRPIMGAAVAELSDVAVLTSDNPRTEDPEAILHDVLPGLVSCPEVHSLVNRRAALEKAVSLLQSGDVLLVAGKGHEQYQTIGTTKQPFSDQAIVRELLA